MGDFGGRRLDVVALEHGSLVADLAGDERSGELKAEVAIVGEPELMSAHGDVPNAEPLGDPIKPTPLREKGDRDLVLAERLDGLSRDLDVTEETDLAGFSDANLLNDFVLFLDLQDVSGLADGEPLGVEVERAEVVSRGDELARPETFGGGGFFRVE